jgi:hypothetical protein
MSNPRNKCPCRYLRPNSCSRDTARRDSSKLPDWILVRRGPILGLSGDQQQRDMGMQKRNAHQALRTAKPHHKY